MANVKRTFSLPDEISLALDETIPRKRRSKFIAVTLQKALQEKNREKLLTLLETMPCKKNPQNIRSEDILRQFRDERAQEILDNSRP